MNTTRPITIIKPIVTAATLASVIVATVSCGGGPAPSLESPAPRIQVVTTSVILEDFVKNVGGDRVDVVSLVPPGADVHSLQSTPKDSLAVNKAAVIVSNGLGLDAFLDGLLESARSPNSVHVVGSEGLESVSTKGGVAGGDDPHLWLNPLAVHYVGRIRDGLAQADPTNAQLYQTNAAAYIQELRELDQEIALSLDTVPARLRRLVTFHDAFGHFAQHYQWKVSAFVVSDASDVTPGAVVKVVEQIEEQGIPVVFAEPQMGGGVLSRVAEDAGVQIGRIYSDSLDDDVPTYIDMMRFNARSLTKHLAGQSGTQ